MSETTAATSVEAAEPLVIDVRTIPKSQRHPLIFDAMEPLSVGQSVVIKNDHNPIPLRGQVEAIYGQQFEWRYLEEGPEVFRLQFTRRAPTPAGWQRPESKKSNLPMIPGLPTAQDLGTPTAPSTIATAPGVSPPAAVPSPVEVDLLAHSEVATQSGPQWAHESEDLDVTLLSWEADQGIEPHLNQEVDVVWVGVAGAGTVVINGQKHELRPGCALLIPKGCERGVANNSERFSYLSVHRRRRGLMPTLKGKPLPD
ncbi:MAG: DUF2249 domain-containing protein [Abitibacteriaceae bacterium]|nr:DUF2249 domain-containing protein [Abditibacteriaceae bacterium]